VPARSSAYVLLTHRRTRLCGAFVSEQDAGHQDIESVAEALVIAATSRAALDLPCHDTGLVEDRVTIGWPASHTLSACGASYSPATRPDSPRADRTCVFADPKTRIRTAGRAVPGRCAAPLLGLRDEAHALAAGYYLTFDAATSRRPCAFIATRTFQHSSTERPRPVRKTVPLGDAGFALQGDSRKKSN
jgi:hypothetical protein